jgi:TolB-like protein/DNA-binding winged helix-turn-helix (wHTH) protein/tetratricopeptide (TPR) repeat protein
MASPSPSPEASTTTPDPGPTSSSAHIVRFGLFEADLRARELRKRGVKVRLPDQPFQVLQLLLEHPGDVVMREELRQRLWSADTFVDFDLSLNSAVRKLREALGDSAEHSTFIETLPRRGYRFIASVERPPAADAVAPATESQPPRRRSRARLLWGVTALVVLPIGALIVRNGWTGSGPTVLPIRSVAVLPLQNLTGDPAREYVVDGMTDALITELAQVGVPVISRMSSMQYKGTQKRPLDIARQLNVDGIVAGAASLSGSQVRMNVQLIHAATDRHVWADHFERDAKDVMTLSAQVARAIATAIGKGGAPRSFPPRSRTSPVSPEAYDLYAKALLAANATYEGLRTATSYLEQAIARQPDFGMAHARLAQAWIQYLTSGPMSPDEVLPKAESAARKALDLDDTLSYAHMALASVRHMYGDYAAAMAHSDRSMELAPFNAQSLVQHTRLLMSAGRNGEAAVAAERARKLDPLSVNAVVVVANTLSAVGQHTRALEELNKALKMAPQRADVPFQLGATYVLKGDIKAAIPEFEKAVALSTQRNPRFRAYLGYAYGIDGRTRESQQLLQELLALRERQYVSSFGIALIQDALGDKAATLTALERAVQEHALEFVMLYLYPPFRTLASEPRFQELIQHYGANR